MPLMVGAVSTMTGSLRLGFIVPLVGVVLMLGFYLFQSSQVATFSEEPLKYSEKRDQAEFPGT